MVEANENDGTIVIGVLALQGAFREHLQLLNAASKDLSTPRPLTFKPIKTAHDLSTCAALIIPGGESTTIARIAETSNLLEPLRDFVKVHRKPTWGTCAGMILLSESANRTKAGGQELIGGLDVRVNRNHFGRQKESFAWPLEMRFLQDGERPFEGVFIRAPVVESLLKNGRVEEGEGEVLAPGKSPKGEVEKRLGKAEVEVLVSIPKRVAPAEGLDQKDRPKAEVEDKRRQKEIEGGESSIVAVRQGNVVGTSFHPELTGDTRMHRWWLEEVLKDLESRTELAKAA